MIPVDQTRTGKPCGNCMEACFASLLEVSLDEVPDLEDKKFSDWEWCQKVLTEWLASYGLWWVDFSVKEEDGFFEEHRIPDGAWVMMNGDNQDGVPHSVVGQKKNGKLKMAHDPNPLRRGIVELKSIGVLIPIEPRRLKNETNL